MRRQLLLRAAFPLLIALCSLLTAKANGAYHQDAFQRVQMDIPPPGVSSLTFVFDRTGSMNDDLVQVRHGAKGIFETVLKQRKKLIYNYVLVLFHDPEVDPPFVTTDPDVFQSELASVSVQGGGDCPEMALSGIKKALEVSLPGSYIYVFTDARAKDYHLEERILNLIQEKHSSVVFVMTGDCGNRTAPGYRTFEKIAAASFGQVFHLEKSHVNTVLEYVRHAVEQRMIHLLYEVRERGQMVISPVAVDGLMTELTISLSGQRDDSEWLNITLIDPEGDTVDKATYENQAGTIDLKNVKLIRVTNPQPGTWKVRTTSKNKHTLRIFGHSTIDFKYGFSTRVVDSIELAHPRPIANQLTYLIVNMTGLNPPGLLMQVSLLDYHGRILYRNESRLHTRNGNLYYVGPLMPPKGFFFVRVQGEDETGYEFNRISSTAISTVDSSGPRAFMSDRTMATAFQPVNLTCSVESVSPYTIYWQYGQDVIGGPLFYQHTDTSIWTIDAVTPQNRGYYTCLVVSSAGNHSATTYLDSREPPPHITTLRNYTVILQQSAFLHCQTQSSEQARIVWERNGVIVGNSAKVYQYPNGTLRILDASIRDSGYYLCRATTSGGMDEARMFLSVYDLPRVIIKPPLLYVAPGPELMVRSARVENLGIYECRASSPAGIAMDAANVQFAVPPQIQINENKLMIGRGGLLQLDCRVLQGVPKPTIKWFKNDRELYPNSALQLDYDRLTIPNAQESDAGSYSCRAENIAGSYTDQKTIDVGVSPTIVPSPERVQGNIESSIKLQCRALGAPNPKISWTKDRSPISLENKRFSILADGSLMIRDIQVEDQGYFTCEAKNEFGVQFKNTLLVVTGLVSPILAQSPTEANLIEGQDLILNCIVLLGTPKPKTQWFKNKQEIQTSEKTIIQSDGSLLLRDGLAEQQGDYECRAVSPAGTASLNVNVLLISKPTLINGSPTVVHARAHEPLDLKCPIRSTDEAKALWMLEGQPLHGNTASYTIMPDNTLRIHNPDHVHEGRYTCSIANQAGEVTASVVVQIQTAPLIAAAQSSFNLVQGDTVALACEVDASPAAEISWLFNDAPIEDPPVDETGALVLDSVNEQQRGVYKCVAENSIGRDEREILVTVHIAPIIEGAGLAKTKHAIANETVRLECPARASPPPERRWSYEGTPLFARSYDSTQIAELDSDGALLIRQVQLTHSGLYTCRISNLAGEASLSWQLYVLVPPSIVQSLPPQVDGIVNIPLAMACRAQGTPQPTIQWEYEGVGLSGDDERFVQTSTGTLRLSQPRASDSGLWKCWARNQAGEDSSQTILTVREPPTIRSTQKLRYQLVEGLSGQVYCEINAHPLPTIEWFQEEQLLTSGNGIEILNNGTLIFEKTERSQAGLYLCTATNSAGKVDVSINIEVLTPPEIRESEQPEQRYVADGSPMILHCPVASHQQPQISWFWNAKPLASFAASSTNRLPQFTLSDDKRRLMVQKSQIADTGNFTCVARNAAGEASKSFLVEINIAPRVDNQQKRQVTVLEGERVEITCPVNGHPPPNITWLSVMSENGRNAGLQLGGQNGEKLIIENAQLHQSGSIVCIASNRAGSVDATVNLEVLATPKIVRSNETPRSALIGKPVSLSCDVENSDPTTRIKWLFNGKENLPSNVQIPPHSRRLIILESTEEHHGQFSCVVTNKVGESTLDFPLEINVPPQLLDPSQAEEVALIEGQHRVLHCDVRGHPPPRIQWFRDGVLQSAANGQTSLTVEAASESDALTKNRFSCVATNEAGSVSKEFFVNSIFAPKLLPVDEQERKIDVFEGNTATLECPVENLRLDDLSIHWYQRGRPLDLGQNSKHYSLSSDRTRLTILGVHHNDEGEYSCVAKNEAGEISSPFELKVLVLPIIEGDAETSVELVEGEELDLECIFEGQPLPSASWTKDGLPTPKHSKLLSENRFLYVDKSTSVDAGIYICRVENSAGVVTKKFDVRVIGRPKLLREELASQEIGVPIGQSAILECSVRVDPNTETEYNWLKEGRFLALDTWDSKYKLLDKGRKLQILFAAEDDSRLFTCLAKNRAGEVKQEFELLVKIPPSITSTANQYRVIENASLVIPCEAHGTPKPKIEYLRNGNLITSGRDGLEIVDGGQQLRIPSARADHDGFFVCRATNEIGQAEIGFGVEVIQRPILTDTTTQQLDVTLGDSFSFNCPLKNMTFSGNITWLFNNAPVPTNQERFKIMQNGLRLYVLQATEDDRGEYSCVVNSNAKAEAKCLLSEADRPSPPEGPMTYPTTTQQSIICAWKPSADNGGAELVTTRKNYALNVLVPPSISLLERDKRRAIIENGTVELECPASGHPQPSTRWYKDGVPLEAETINSVLPGASLVGTAIRIENIQESTGSGRYTCEAQNSAGIVDLDILVQVMTRPVIQRNNQTNIPIDGEIGGRAELECKVNGNPTPTITWLQDGTPIQVDEPANQIYLTHNQQKLNFVELKKENAGKYSCIAKNSAGEDRRDFELRFLEEPKIDTSNIPREQMFVRNRTMTLSCPATGKPEPSIVWLRDRHVLGVNDALGQEHDPRVTLVQGGRQLKVEKVEDDDAGLYSCLATNAGGSTDLQIKVTIVDFPKIYGPAIEEVSTLLNKRHVLNCDVDPRSEPFTIEWLKSGQLVGSARDETVESEAYIQITERGQKLHILAAQRSDAAKWTCKVENPAGEALKEFDMTILIRPQIDESRSSPSIVSALHGDEVELNCQVEANPTAKITWTKDGQPIEFGRQFVLRSENQTLRIPTATSAENGRFSCYAENDVGTTSRNFVVELEGPPIFETSEEMRILQLGESFALNCEPTSGNPPFEFAWSIDGRPLDKEEDPAILINGNRLLLNGALMNHSAVFGCSVQNAAGEGFKTFDLHVHQRPRFIETTHDANPTIIAGRSLVLDCAVEGVPRPIVTWRKDGEILTATSGREFINNHQQLSIDEATESDAGIYSCVAESPSGTSSKTIVVTTLEAPVMLQTRFDVEARENETLSLTCPVKDAANARIEWTQNQQPITTSSAVQISENGNKLHFLSVQKHHRGVYSCLAENEAGGSEAIFDVLVQIAPVIQLPAVGMRNIAVMKDHSITLQCQADGVPAPEITWLFDGVPFANSHGDQLVSLGTIEVELERTAGGAAEFRISNATRQNQGRYTCLTVNKVGKAEADVFVQVMEPPKLRTSSESIRVIQGQEFSVRCEVESGMRPLSAEWTKGDQTLSSLTEEIDDRITYYLHNRQAQPSDAGVYVCKIQNSAGKAQLSIRVDVLVPPKIEAGDRVLKVIEGAELTLDCQAKGTPEPKVVWYFGSKVLSSDNQGHYTIRNAQASHSGRYTCEAQNAADTVSADFHVEVLVKPRIRPYDKVVRVLERESTHLECKFEGNPEPTVKWMRSGKTINTADSSVILSPRGESLLIPKTERSDAGDYSCLLSNSAGTAEAPFVVLVQTAPHIDETIDQNPRIIEGNSVLLICPVLADPQPQVRWRHGDRELKFTANENYRLEGTNLRIEKTTVDNGGRYTCHAENDIGGLDTEYELEVMAAPRFESAGQRVFEAIEGQPISLECPAEASPQPTIEWFRGTVQLNGDSNTQISPTAKKLKILNSTLDNAGKFTCRATNVAGSTEIDLTLKVIVPPQIDESNLITSPLGVLGRSIYLECPVRAIPEPSIHWLKDGKRVEQTDVKDLENAKFSLQQANQTFGIRKVEHGDRGIYTCVVENQGGKVSQDFNVEVLIPPVMEKQEAENVTKREGDTLMLSCPIKNTLGKTQNLSDLTVTWTQDGRPLDPKSDNVEISHDGKHLKLKNLRVANAGQYKCVAANRAGQTHTKFNVDILSIPKIEEEKINETPNVPVGHATTLWCPVSGHPPPTVRWFKGNGEEVRNIPGRIRLLDRGQGLEIAQAGLEDIGTWTCRAENNAGVTEKAIKLNVWVEPKVQVRALNDETIVQTGTTVTLFCNASGNPKPALSWNYNDQLIIPTSENLQISLSVRNIDSSTLFCIQGGRLDIAQLQEPNVGNYSCLARNELGSAEDTIAVDILVPPEINRENVKLNQQLPTGRSISLFCDASGKPPPEIQWYFNDKLITDEFANVVMGTDNKFIQIANVTLDDKGIYKCTVANDAGGDQLQYNISVNLAPSIANSGTTQVIEGDVAVLECKAEGFPRPKITWQRNGIRVETGLRYVVENRVLKIIDTHSSDSGIYVCVASNEAGTDQQAFTIEVLVSPEIVKKSPNETIVAVGGQFSLECGTLAHPPAQHQWTYEDEPIEDALADVNYTIAEDGTLTISGFEQKGDLPFRCSVSNAAGEASVSYVVKAISAPARIGPNETQQVNSTQGQPTILLCGIDVEVGVKSKVTWTRNGEQLQENDDLKMTVEGRQGRLQLDDTSLKDEGIYECTVTTPVGNAQRTTQLFVGVPPKISDTQRKIIVKRGERAKVSCEAVGIPPPQLQWTRDNINVTKGNVVADEDNSLRLSMIFDDIQPEDAGVYTCSASSWAGNDERDYDLVVLIPPIITPERIDINASLSDEYISLPCNATGIPEPVVTWVKVPNMDLIGREDRYVPFGSSLIIRNISIDDDDFFHCIAKSSAGQAIGVRRVTVNNLQLEGPPRVWVECDSDGQPIQSSFLPPRGDSPEDVNPANIEYLPWEDRHLHAERQGPNVVFYKCVPSSRDQRSGSTHVPSDSPPQLIEQPPRLMKIAKDEGLRLKCSATGSPPPIVIWTKGDATIHESFDGFLDLKAAENLPGLYACIVRNSAGEQKSVVNVEHQSAKPSKPKPDPPVPLTILNCDPKTAANATEIFWEMDGQRIEANVVNDRMHVLANGSLVLSYFVDGDELGQFECVAFTNDDEEKRHKAEKVIYVELEERPPKVDIPQPKRIDGQINGEIRIDCLLLEGTALTTRIRWTKNNVNLEMDGIKYTTLPNNSLVIGNLADADRGSYKCRAWNRKGKSYDETGLVVGKIPQTIEARIHGKINGVVIPPTIIQFATGEANIFSNDLLAKLRNLPLGQDGTATTSLLAGLMTSPALQLGYNPRRQAANPDPKSIAFDRDSDYKFATGELIKVKQKSMSVDVNANKMVIDVDFDGYLPQIQDDNIRVDAVESEITPIDAGLAVGRGTSTLHFGNVGAIPFTVDDKIAYKDANPDQPLIEPGSTLRLTTELENRAGNEITKYDEVRFKLRSDRYGNCPRGFVRIKEYCKDIDECSTDSGACAGRDGNQKATCVNKKGVFECERKCDQGYTSDSHGDCVDVNECALGKFNCENGTDCVEACPRGYYIDESSGCVDLNECLRNPCNESMECVNFAGGYECVCPLGLSWNKDRGQCLGLNGSSANSLQHLTFNTEPGPVDCPSGMQWTENTCYDVDECAFDAPCQYKCINKPGSYECICPPGYVIDELGQCIDIDECQAKNVCGEGELCFNQLGEFSCIANACPAGYRLKTEGSESADCIPTCKNCTKPMIHIYLLPLPAGLPEGTPLARLAAHDNQGRVLRNTTFHEVHGPDTTGTYEDDTALDVVTKDGRATVNLAGRLPPGTKQRLNLRSSSISPDGHHKYASNFHIFTAISKYPF
ncbi:EGF-like domain-containing protein [Aphelenchoides besseyi]|nr:EGF-like domain-containing protein [Aphelenchoides besseyi]